MEFLAVFKVFLQNSSSAQRTASQIADIPVPGRGVSGSLQGFPPRTAVRRSGLLCRSLTFQFLVVEVPAVVLVFTQNREQQLNMFLRNAFLSGLSRSVLVEIFLPRRAGPHGSLPGQSSAARFGTDVRGAGPHGSLPGQGSAVRFGTDVRLGGLQGSVRGQCSTARRGRQFAGQVFLEPDAAGCVGFIESASAQAELACGGDFQFSASYLGRFFTGDEVIVLRSAAAHWSVGSVRPGAFLGLRFLSVVLVLVFIAV